MGDTSRAGASFVRELPPGCQCPLPSGAQEAPDWQTDQSTTAVVLGLSPSLCLLSARGLPCIPGSATEGIPRACEHLSYSRPRAVPLSLGLVCCSAEGCTSPVLCKDLSFLSF